MEIVLLKIALFLAPLGSFWAAWKAWQRRKSPAALPMVILGLAAGAWAVLYNIQLRSPDITWDLLAARLVHVCVSAISISLAAFLLRMAGWRSWPGWRLGLALLAFPLLTQVVIWTNDWHHWFWSSMTRVDFGAYWVLKTTRGPWYWVHALYSYGLILAAFSASLAHLDRSSVNTQRQVTWLVVGIAPPLLVNLLGLAGIELVPGIDLTSVGFGLSAMLLGLTSGVRILLDVVPLAHTTLVAQMQDGLVVLDTQGFVQDANPAVCLILGVEPGGLVGCNVHQVDCAMRTPVLLQMLQSPGMEPEKREVQTDDHGRSRWYEITRLPLYAGERPPAGLAQELRQEFLAGYLLIWHEITHRKQIEGELRHASTHDQMTGLYNRMFFEETFEQLRKGRTWPVGIVLADLDNLKATNDQRGHPAGDELLRGAAHLLQGCLRAGDLLARIGGDEFAILLPGQDEEATQALVTRLRTVLGAGYPNAPEMEIAISLGWGVAREPAALQEALQRADQRMYRDKAMRKRLASMADPFDSELPGA